MKNISPTEKQKNIIIKSFFGLLIAIVSIVCLFVIKYTQLVGKIVGFIFYLSILSIIIYEFINIFPIKKYFKIYFCFLGIICFFLSWESIYYWFTHDDKYNQLITSQYVYDVCGIPGIGYVVLFVLCLIPFLFINKNIKTIIKYFLLTFIIISIFSIVARSLMISNVENFWFMLLIYSGTIICDVFGYFGGLMMGNRIFKNKKLAPTISPNKTIEGAFVAFVVCWTVLFLMLWFLDFNLNINNIVLLVVVPIIIPILSILGDLIFSKIKRIFKVKDYSNLIPGHGGVLDRIDAIIITSFIALSLAIVL